MLKSRKFLIMTIGVIFVLLVGTLLYAFLRDEDPYRYYTGLGEHIAIAPADSKIAFSYYMDGEESIYTANSDGTDAKKMTDSKNRRERSPKYSPDGKRLAFLSRGSDGVQALQVMNEDGSGGKRLTDGEFHVADAIFSRDGESVFFVAVEAEEFKKGEESTEGFDLFSIRTDGKQMKKLTNADYFSMNHLFLSPDGRTVYFSEFGGEKERIHSYAIGDGKVNEKPSFVSGKVANELTFNEPALSKDGKRLAFTDVTKESENSPLYEYELFVLDVKKGKAERLTHLKKAVTSPEFFHEQDKIAFLENTNWADAPAKYRLKTVDAATRQMETIELDTPQSTKDHRFMQSLDRSVNMYTIAALYVLFGGLLSVYAVHYRPGKAYLPSIISFSLAVLTFVTSFAVTNPWDGLGLFFLAAGILGCSVVIVLFAFVYKRLVRRSVA